MCGEGGVGKTTLARTYIDPYSSNDTKTEKTILADYYVWNLFMSEDTSLWIQIWDLSGAEHFLRTGIYKDFVKGATACLLCFDLTDISSYLALDKWMEFIPPDTLVFLIGTKLDLASEKEKIVDLSRFQKNYNHHSLYKCSSLDEKAVLSTFSEIINLSITRGD